MLISIATKRRFKLLAFYLIFNLLAQIIFPTAAMALTSGPSQPESGSFEPVNTNQMVDLFSGDFTYNIPLLNVPGPNGGYPVNLAYHAGIGMEDEASWTGLGWNINVGAINRNLRGMPDDFSGEDVRKTVSMKPQRKMSLGLGYGIEVVGADSKKVINTSTTVYYDNYKGVGMNMGIGFATGNASMFGGQMQGSLTISNDTKEGIGVSPSLSYTRQVGLKAFGFETGLSFNSRQGLQAITFSSSIKFDRKMQNSYRKDGGLNVKEMKRTASYGGAFTAGGAFAASTYVPMMDMPKYGVSFNANVQAGTDAAMLDNSPVNTKVSYFETGILIKTIDFGGYGYMYAEENKKGRNIADFNREKFIPVNKKSKFLPIPSATYDIYAVKGQGVGGVFRTFRSDVGIFHDPIIQGASSSNGFGLEVGIGPGSFKGGGNVTFGGASSYSGPWQSDHEQITNRYKFLKNSQIGNVYYEPAYLRALGETLPAEKMLGGAHNNDNEPYRFNLGLKSKGDTREPIARDVISRNAQPNERLSALTPQLGNRQKRVQSISYLTNTELQGTTIENISNFTSTISNYRSVDYNYQTTRPGFKPQNVEKQIGQISILNPDGNYYVYGLPTYNHLQRDVSFSVASGDGEISTGRNRTYTSTGNNADNTIDNKQGQSHLFSKTEMSPYSHSNLLTAVLSADYVDVTNDGPSEDDLGYWVKFNYIEKINDYKWRAPYEKDEGNNVENYFSNDKDDQSGYSYGEKEIMYLESIETKTHIAEFHMSERLDGYGVAGENGGIGGADQRLLKLDKIVLKSKSNTNQPIKTVHFSYDYELCKNVPNNIATGQGKLTLKKVWFTYLNNDEKGELSPYEFAYGDTDHNPSTPAINPSYDKNKIDRWGNFQKQGPFSKSGGYVDPDQNYPYVNQHEEYTNSQRGNDASAWNLSDVIMPSGGVLKIDYESDDYGYVQNRKAQQMVKILGTGGSSLDPSAPLNSKDDRIYFEIPKNTPTQADLDEMVTGVNQIYFKAYMKLKDQFESFGNVAHEYVEGYAKPDGTSGLVSGTNIGWIGVQMVNPGQVIQTPTHPIKLAGLRSLRFNRPDLLSGQNDGLSGAINSVGQVVAGTPAILSAVTSSFQLIFGFYNYGIMAGWCDEINISNEFPSYLRLNTPTGNKFGGGCRVKEVQLDDSWSELNTADYESHSYGQQYDYKLENGKSSGVAEYEPLIGGEENPFRQPVRFSSEQMIIKDNAMMIEEPFNENLFPSPGVGYSRVIVRNRIQKSGADEITKSVSGVTINEFYTARDFPVFTKETGIDHEGYNVTIPLPFIGSYSHKNNGYAQGYAIELNNMHGKPYSVATYALPEETNPVVNPLQPGSSDLQPIASTYYYYKTQGEFVRNKSTGNRLDNEVTVMLADAVTETVEIGKHVETYVDMLENKTSSFSGGLQTNLNAVLPFVWVPVVMPSVDDAQSMFRSVTTNKVITRNAILESQVTSKEGARTVTKNLYFDAETGSPLLTTTTNDFGQPIYDYSYPAHWEYGEMGGAYKNIGAIVTNLSSGVVQPGDEVIELGNGNNRIWVEGAGSFVDENGNSVTPSGGSYKVVRSRFRNQQTVPMGNIVSLSNPVGEQNFPLFTAFNEAIKTAPIAGQSISNIASSSALGNVEDCLTGNVFTTIEATIYDYSKSILYFNNISCKNEKESLQIGFDNTVDLTDNSNFDISTATLTLYPKNKVKAESNGIVIWGNLSYRGKCLNACLDGVLHASAAKFKHYWDINYADATTGVPVATPSVRYGSKYVWRLHQSYVFDANRKQTNPVTLATNTQTGKDGTYDRFAPFKWQSSEEDNLNWVKANQINEYSPYGFELENEDALGIKSAALYGYNNSVVTAVASNTSYKELAFNGFEDYEWTGSEFDYTLPTSPNHGHIPLTGNGIAISTNEAHTGNASLHIPKNTSAVYTGIVSSLIQNESFTVDEDEEYYLSLWVKSPTNAGHVIKIESDGQEIPVFISNNVQKIEGWQRVKARFRTGAINETFKISFIANTNAEMYVDDLRIQPFVSSMKTYVYDPLTLWLKAELDDRNYATIYSYDEEGSLVQIKKETKDGMRTIVSNRKNVRKKQ